jgi:uncharacterized YigZ family protein
MKEIQNDIICEQEINKSLFISYLKKVTTVDEAKAYINEIKKMHPAATHHVSVYVVGKNGEIGHTTDDKEPSGTAGLPILEVFKKNEVTNFVIIVVRYFGGIKLGAGGLIRAYSSSASLALNKTKLIEIITMESLKISFTYSHLKLIEQIIANYQIIKKDFSHNVTYVIEVPQTEKQEIIKKLINVTNNQIIYNDDN